MRPHLRDRESQAKLEDVVAVRVGEAGVVAVGRNVSGEENAVAIDLRGAFARITESLGTRYLLGYEPPNPGKPGYRRIDVRVSREGAKVFTRRGYLMK